MAGIRRLCMLPGLLCMALVACESTEYGQAPGDVEATIINYTGIAPAPQGDMKKPAHVLSEHTIAIMRYRFQKIDAIPNHERAAWRRLKTGTANVIFVPRPVFGTARIRASLPADCDADPIRPETTACYEETRKRMHGAFMWNYLRRKDADWLVIYDVYVKTRRRGFIGFLIPVDVLATLTNVGGIAAGITPVPRDAEVAVITTLVNVRTRHAHWAAVHHTAETELTSLLSPRTRPGDLERAWVPPILKKTIRELNTAIVAR